MPDNSKFWHGKVVHSKAAKYELKGGWDLNLVNIKNREE
jgi:hypothetical protein